MQNLILILVLYLSFNQIYSNKANPKPIGFAKKFNDSLWKHMKTDGAPEPKIKEVYNKITNLIGNGNYLIVFDCKQPSYIDSELKTVPIKTPKLLSELKKQDNCSTKSDNLWHYHGDKNFLTTFNLKTKNFTSNLLPFDGLIDFFSKLEMCDEFMKHMKHPAYFKKNFKKPAECSMPAKPSMPKFGFGQQQQQWQQWQQWHQWQQAMRFQQMGMACPRPGG